MGLKIQYLIAALVLIILPIKAETEFENNYYNTNLRNSDGNTDYKERFGEEFGRHLKVYHAELLHSSMDRYKELFNNLISTTNPSRSDRRRFEEHLETVKEIQNEIGQSVDVKLIRKMKDFGKTVVLELVLYRFSSGSNGEAVQRSLESSAELEKQDAKVFKTKLYNKYHEMFKKIPAGELQKHYEYEEIDELLERVANRDTDEAASLANLLEYVSVFRKLGDFFGYPEYKEMFA